MSNKDMYRKLIEEASPNDIYTKNQIILPFDEVNSTFEDMLNSYLEPVLSSEAMDKLRKLPSYKAKGECVLNVYRTATYPFFLQLIAWEDYRVNRDRDKTMSINVIYSEIDIDMKSLPVFQNTRSSWSRYEAITKTEYAQVSADHLWLIEDVTRSTKLGRTTTLTELNLYVPDSLLRTQTA